MWHVNVTGHQPEGRRLVDNLLQGQIRTASMSLGPGEGPWRLVWGQTSPQAQAGELVLS